MSTSSGSAVLGRINTERGGRIVGIIGVLLAWQILASFFPAGLLPFPGEIAVLIWTLLSEGVVLGNLSITLLRTVLGFLAATVFGVAIGILLGINDTTERWTIPYLLVGLSISGLSSGAVAFLIFGFTILSPIVATLIAVFPYIAINVWKGVENIDWDLIEMSTSFGVSTPRILRRSVIPNISPSLFAAYRFGLATSWKIVTVVEIFGSSKGVGHKLFQSYSLQQFNRAWAWGVMFMLVVLAIEYLLIKPIERRVFEYREDAEITF